MERNILSHPRLPNSTVHVRCNPTPCAMEWDGSQGFERQDMLLCRIDVAIHDLRRVGFVVRMLERDSACSSRNLGFWKDPKM